MTNEETVTLVRFVKAVCPQQAIDPYTPDAWHEVLGHLNLDECLEAVATIARQQPFVSTSEIIAEVVKSVTSEMPHSNACRDQDHKECRVSWCNCYCHPANLQAPASRPDPHQLGTGHDDPDSPWGSVDMFKPPE